MSGRIEPAYLLYGILLIAACGAVTDLLRGRIYNWVTFPAMAAGVAASILAGGWPAGGSSLIAIVLALALYGWIFAMGAMGGGDVKFLMALGAWGGSRYVLEVALLGVMLGGAMALGALIVQGRLIAFGEKLYRFVLSIAIRELEVERPRIDHSLTIPFGVPIAAAAAWAAFANPLAYLFGVHL